MRHRTLLKAIVAASLTLAAAPPLIAQYPQARSIDYLVAEADQVIVGRILSTDGTTRNKEGILEGVIILSIEKTLKGDQLQGSIVLPLADWGDAYKGELYPATSDALTDSHRFLVALRHDGQGRTRISAIDLDSPSLAVMSADLVVLKAPADVIRVAEAEVRRISEGGQRIEAFDWPAPGYDVKGDPFYGYQIILPVDTRLEERAHTILKRGPRAQRGIAIGALRFFKSDENIRILTGLISDANLYELRYAKQVLNGWGIDVADPATHE